MFCIVYLFNSVCNKDVTCESVCTYVATYSFCGVLKGLAYACVRTVLQLVTEQGQGRYRTSQWRVPSAGVSLNYSVQYYIRFYRALVINLIV
jgi:hypothetical protein